MKQVFESERISYVEVSEELIGDYLVMVNDDEHVNRFIGGHYGGAPRHYTEEDEANWVRGKLAAKDPVFSMIEKATGEFIGNVELMDPDGIQAELGIAITADKQDKGFGTEAVAAMTGYGLKVLGLRRIFLRTRIFNSRARHVYEKCGFAEYDRNGDHVFMEYRGNT